jgi:hypothetical protein
MPLFLNSLKLLSAGNVSLVSSIERVAIEVGSRSAKKTHFLEMERAGGSGQGGQQTSPPGDPKTE